MAMDDDELGDIEYRNVYAHFGLSVFVAQSFEKGFVNLVSIIAAVRSKAADSDQMRSILTTYERKTVGRLLTDMLQLVDINDEAKECLADALETRNFLIHRYFNERIGQLVTEQGRPKIIEELKDMRRTIERASTYVAGFTKALLDEADIGHEKLAAAATKLFGDELGKHVF